MKKIVLFLIFLNVLLYGCVYEGTSIKKSVEGQQLPAYCESGIHYHADLKVFIENKELNLYKTENIEQDDFIHFHDGENQGKVIHFHKEGTLADFLNTVDYNELKECILSGNSYYFYVNGEPSDLDLSKYVVKDLDKLLIKCGSEKPTMQQIESVGNLSIIQESEVCGV